MIALYARVSTQEQAIEGYSIGDQQEKLQAFASSFGWKGTKLYTDPGFSGANMDRPALKQMLRDVKAKKISKVIVYKLDRLSRSQKDTLYMIEDVFLANSCEFVSMSESFSTETPVGRATIGLLAVFAQLERENIKERTHAGRHARCRSGLYHGGGDPISGYDYINGKLIINEYEAFQVREAFRLFLSGMSLEDIVREFNARGYTTKSGKWGRGHLRYLLANETYAGYVRFSGKIYKGQHEPLISEEDMQRAKALIKKRAEDYKEARLTSSFHDQPLIGLVYCAKCGARYTSNHSRQHGNEYYYYTCTRKRFKSRVIAEGKEPCDGKTWKAEDLEALVFGEMSKISLDAPICPNKPVSHEGEESAIEAKVARISRQISRLVDLYASEMIDLDVLEQKVQALSEEKEALEARLEKSEKHERNEEEIRQALLSMKDAVEAADPSQLARLARVLIHRIEINDDDVRIIWNL